MLLTIFSIIINNNLESQTTPIYAATIPLCVFMYKLRSVFVGCRYDPLMCISVQAAESVRRSYATKLRESHLQSGQMWRTSFAVNLLSCNYKWQTANLQCTSRFYDSSIKKILHIIRRHVWNWHQWMSRTVSVIKIVVFNINLCSLSLILLFSFFDNLKTINPKYLNAKYIGSQRFESKLSQIYCGYFCWSTDKINNKIIVKYSYTSFIFLKITYPQCIGNNGSLSKIWFVALVR